MTLLVRNEADIVRQNIEFHLSRGVDHVIATDNASSDGTTEILEEFSSLGQLTLIREPSDEYRQKAWVNRMISRAVEMFDEAWIINNDADEFWRPPNGPDGRVGNLKEVLAKSSTPCVICQRANMITSTVRLKNSDWADALLWRSTIRAKPRPAKLSQSKPLRHPFFCHRLPSKVIVHSRNLLEVEKGAHSAKFEADIKSEDLGVEIFHYPIRSVDEFCTSVTYISKAIMRDPDLKKNQSGKYLRWADILETTGSCKAILEDALPKPSRFWMYRLTRRLIKDVRLRDDLASIYFQ
ncbi:MAG: glycosyltransferase family 2 protein [Paracoccaceae bacterium]|nr:glycosyltransferase family 2 protein [Paracoccaceae bacterium]